MQFDGAVVATYVVVDRPDDIVEISPAERDKSIT